MNYLPRDKACNLLAPQALHRVDPGSLKSLQPYCKPRDQQCQQTRTGKVPPLQADAVGKVTQPVLGNPVTQGQGNDDRYDNHLAKV